MIPKLNDSHLVRGFLPCNVLGANFTLYLPGVLPGSWKSDMCCECLPCNSIPMCKRGDLDEDCGMPEAGDSTDLGGFRLRKWPWEEGLSPSACTLRFWYKSASMHWELNPEQKVILQRMADCVVKLLEMLSQSVQHGHMCRVYMHRL